MTAQAIDLTPAKVDVTMTAGDDLDLVLTARWPDGSPVDCSGERLAQVRASTEDAVAATFTTTGTPDGTLTLHLDGAITAGLVDVLPLRAAGARALYAGVWDVEVTDPSTSAVRTLAGGRLTVALDVSRAEVTP